MMTYRRRSALRERVALLASRALTSLFPASRLHRYLAFVLCFGVVFAGLLIPRFAEAHSIGLSSGEYVVSGGTVTATLAFARAELVRLAPDLDQNRDGTLTEQELAAGLGVLEETTVRRITVLSDGEPCAPRLVSAKPTDQDGVSLEGTYTCSKPGAKRVVLGLLSSLPKGHRHLARQLREGSPKDDILLEGHDTFDLFVPGTNPLDSKGTKALEPKRPSTFAGFFTLGMEHILTGYDHLAFLLGLVLVRGKPRSYLAVVTAFTVAHSMSLALSVLNVVTPSTRFVEPAIALSIAYVGVENFFVKDVARRWRITFPFGLLHGFGFAGALREIQLPRAQVPAALVSFNLGVEAGQLAVLLLVVPLLFWMTKRHTNLRLTRGLSAAVAIAGLVWFFARVFAAFAGA